MIALINRVWCFLFHLPKQVTDRCHYVCPKCGLHWVYAGKPSKPGE